MKPLRTALDDLARRPFFWLVGFGALFALLASGWLPSFDRAAPVGERGFSATTPQDARLLVAILGMVARLLRTNPLGLYDLPIFYPAPYQLTGSEHLLSSQILFAPVFYATGNALLAANAVLFTCYVLAAAAMAGLTRALGATPTVACVAGFAFALGPMQAPADLHVLQYMNFYLPLVALALFRLRSRPDRRRALALFLVLTLGLFSSYYLAAMLAVSGLALAALETFRLREHRGRFLLTGLAAALPAVLLLAAFSLPYFAVARPPLGDANRTGAAATSYLLLPLAERFFQAFGYVGGSLAIAGALAGAVRAGRAERRIWSYGVILLSLGYALALQPLLPFGMPTGFFRSSQRFLVISGFGAALLVAAALGLARRGLGPSAGRWTAALVFLALLVEQGLPLFQKLDEIRPFAADRPVFETIRGVARKQPAGPLLELPIALEGRSLAAEAMVAATIHGLPLVTGYTGYDTPGGRLIRHTALAVPDISALRALSSMTHLRWILLHPVEDWPSASHYRHVLRDILLSGLASDATRIAGWLLIALHGHPDHPQWFEALRRGLAAGYTPLGTELAPLPPRRQAALVETPHPPRSAAAGGVLRLTVLVRNIGSDPWPAVPALDPRDPRLVRLEASWRCGSCSEPTAETAVSLPWDVAPGDRLRLDLSLRTPGEPGAYELLVSPRQRAGGAFRGPRHRPLRLRLVVEPRAPSGGSERRASSLERSRRRP